MIPCPTPEQLRLLLADDASPTWQTFSAHLADCARCQANLDQITDAELTQHLRRQPSSTTDPQAAALVDRLRKAGPDSGLNSTLQFPGTRSPESPLGQLGPYQVLREIGAGATALVFLGRDRKLGRLVALKVLRPELAHRADVRARFEREARAAASIQHEHVVAVHDVLSSPAFPPCLVLEYVEGETLRQRLARAGKLAPGEAARLVREVALGLEVAHQRGLVHRDLKPANILIADCRLRSADSSDQSAIRNPQSAIPKIADFGLALNPGGDDTLTHDGQVLGTPAYMSPEQALGQGHHADARSDIYSLGAILYHLLSGRPPYQGASREILYQAIHSEPAPLKDVPTTLNAIVLRCLARNPSERYASAADVADDLDRYLRGDQVRAKPARRWVLFAAALLLLGGVGFAVWHFTRPARPAPPETLALRRNLLDEYLRHGECQLCAEEYAGARNQAQKAVDLAEELARAYPHNEDVEEDRIDAYQLLSEACGELKQKDAALLHQAKALELARAWVNRDPNSGAARSALVDVYRGMGEQSHSRKESRGYYLKALAIQEILVQEDPDSYDAQRTLHDLLLDLGEACEKDKDAKSADAAYSRADALWKRVEAKVTDVEDRVDVLALRIRGLAHRGKHEELIAVARELQQLQTDDETTLYNVGCCYAQCLVALKKSREGASLTEAERAKLQEYSTKAVQFLRRALKAGFNDFDFLLSDPDLKPLRSDPGFRAIVKNINELGGGKKRRNAE